MGIFEIFGKKAKEEPIKKEEPLAYGGSYRPLFNISFDGEKNTGELGDPVKYHLNYNALRLRSWKSYLDSQITQTVVRRYITWIIGAGLKLKSEPVMGVLKSSGSGLNQSTFTKAVEDRFKLFASTKWVDYSERMNLNTIAKTAYKNAIIGGDVLVILRAKNGNINIQLIDGAHIHTPLFGNEINKAREAGNEIKNGIETNSKGVTVAFHVLNSEMKYERIAAKGNKTGREMAFMVYGLQYRIDDNRGIPLISTTLETLDKLDRYKEATVGSAEERAKVPFTIQHSENAEGTNPFIKNMAKAVNIDSNQDIATDDIQGKQLADNIAVSMNKQVYNLPPGAKLVATDTKSDVNFDAFYKPNVEGICSAIGIPPEVALSKYDSNFSASRAALKDWEHTISVERTEFSFQFYQKVYDFWLDLEVLKTNIQAEGYLNAMAKGDNMLLTAFRNSRFVGANVPHIDPLKEVKAEREKLGSTGAHIPLTTVEAATEALNSGDAESNILQYSDELTNTENAGIEPPEQHAIEQQNTKPINDD